MPLFPAYAQQLIFFNLNKSTDDYKLEALHGIKKQSPKVQYHLKLMTLLKGPAPEFFCITHLRVYAAFHCAPEISVFAHLQKNSFPNYFHIALFIYFY